ncbi:hypothetical protein NDU88_004367 [Pleurodeles waltl]|uniref:Uncharacterized protein n=1 Tax=Pleurodeles waltl TaxID=8319 RepID=A0AAV7NP47_PLEWA|nr:hypothetical protein NDU88_004367 [Pleurodeles waltl]
MKQYTTPVVLLQRVARLEVSGDAVGTPLSTEEPSRAELLAAIQGSRVVLEGKIETVAWKVNLLRADIRTVSDKVKVAEDSIAELQNEISFPADPNPQPSPHQITPKICAIRAFRFGGIWRWALLSFIQTPWKCIPDNMLLYPARLKVLAGRR